MRWVRPTWLHVTRAAGLLALAYEVTIDKVDKPSLMIVIGTMILGVESVGRLLPGKGSK